MSNKGEAVEAKLRGDQGFAEEFYNERFRQLYMDSWPIIKCARVASLLQDLPLPINGRVLDFGCGTGVFTAVLKNVLHDCEVNGTDISNKALEIARSKQPECFFYSMADCKHLVGQFDFIFSHHVLEHVSDLPKTAEMLFSLLKPSGVMFHILPCADPGSLEHSICLLRKDGFLGAKETRFFFDEEGHLRRLSTQGLADLWARTNLVLERAYYANHLYGGLKFLTENGLPFILDLARPNACVNNSAAKRLGQLRIVLVLLWAIRQPCTVVNNKMKFGIHSFRDCVLFGIGLLAWPASRLGNLLLQRLVNREWQKKSQKRGGSEMYIFFGRGGGLHK